MRRGLAAGLLAAIVCSCRETPAPELRIGLPAILTGRYAQVSGLPAQLGARLAVAELNAAGGVTIGGVAHQVRLVERDFADRADAAATATRALVNLDSVHVLVGPQFSVHAIAAAGVAEDAHVPLIAPMASKPSLTQGRRYVFRLAFLDAFQGEILARYSCESLSRRKAAVLYDAANPYGQDIADLFRATFERCGGRVVASETFTSDRATDFSQQLRRIVASGADVLLLPNYVHEDSIQVRQARELGFRGQFLGSDSWDPPAMRQLPEAQGAVIVGQWDQLLPTIATRRFVARYRAANQDSIPRATAALTYDAVMLVADAARRAGSLDADALVRAIAATERFEGVASQYRFAGRQDPERGGVIMIIRAAGESVINVGPGATPR
ncbi:MAG TPA: ABC transporter substrate-binding protein [Gemmatimonadaceae bacterium]|nr:ABC transporter substrate-binding protein [Gemmatimonadaceae bacterium]